MCFRITYNIYFFFNLRISDNVNIIALQIPSNSLWFAHHSKTLTRLLARKPNIVNLSNYKYTIKLNNQKKILCLKTHLP